MKATYVEVNGEGREIFKDPVTDDGVKKSAKGLLSVNRSVDKYMLIDQCSKEEEMSGELVTIFDDGRFYNEQTIEEIRDRLNNAVMPQQLA